MKKPKPVVVSEVCDICGEDWSLHPENPTVLDCVDILKRRPQVIYRDWWQNPGYPYRINTTASPSTTTLPYFTSASNVTPLHGDDDDGTSGVRVPA